MKYVFIGDRFNVLEFLLEQNLEVIKIFAVKDSYLAKTLTDKKVDFEILKNKKDFLEELKNTPFDILVSNGCPYIIPVSEIKKPDQLFINIHPSYLPDLKGINPINGALLYGRDGGATCHVMDDGIDTGDILAQQKIPLTTDMNLEKLYKLSFAAERDVFKQAFKSDFKDRKPQEAIPDPIYYSRKPEDMRINFEETPEQIVRRVKAFGIESQGAWFEIEGEKIKVLDAEIVKDGNLLSKIENYKDTQIAAIDKNSLIFKKDNVFIRFTSIIGDMSKVEIGNVIEI